MSRKAGRCPLAALSLTAQLALGQDAQAWLREVDDARNAFDQARIEARATHIEDGKVTAEVDFDIYVKGRDKVLLAFRGGKNSGRKALTLGEKMWLIVPGAEHPVPITPNQRLMGGASFGDVARMRFAEDFTAELRAGTEKVGDRDARVLDLTAVSPRAPYPKLTLWLDPGPPARPLKVRFFLTSGKPARDVTFTKFEQVAGKLAVSEMEIRDLLGPQANTLTRLEYLEIQPAKIDDKVFTPEGARAM